MTTMKRNRGGDEPVMTEVEFATGLADATARGLIEWQNDEEMRLTDKGKDHAMNIRETLGDTDYIVLQFFFEIMRECAGLDDSELEGPADQP